MDSVFSDEAARLDFLQSAFHSYGCAYICLWSYSSSSNRLLLLDGFYDVQSLQTSSSLGSTVDQRLFEQYRGLEFDVTSDGRVPGLAFWNQYSYLELQQSDLLRLAWTDIQRQFFQEARIETAVFIGCHNGEIELGFSSVTQGSEIQTDMQRLFPEELCRQSHQVAHKIPPSSPSPLRSESTGSPGQNTCLLFSNIPGSSLLPEMLLLQENEHEGMANKAIHHHVISASPPPSKNSSTSLLLVQDPPNVRPAAAERIGAFKRYRPSQVGQYKPNLRRQSLLKRCFELLRGLHFLRMRERYEETRPTSSQFLHMMSERRRREKLNRNFQALRSLLPPETKKDKASILIAAKEALSSLMAENEKMGKKDHEQVKAKMKAKELLTRKETKASSSTTDERLLMNVRVSDVAGSSSSGERFTDLHVTVIRRQSYFLQQVDILSPLLEFLKGVQRVSLISVDASTRIAQGNAFNEATLRLKIEGSEWDEAAFEEAVRAVVANLAK